jgi:hypothetical protein
MSIIQYNKKEKIMYENSNLNYIECPYCKIDIVQEYGNILDFKDRHIDEIQNDEKTFVKCLKCEKYFKLSLTIFKEYNYTTSKLLKKEMKEYELFSEKDIIKDLPGQSLMWKD